MALYIKLPRSSKTTHHLLMLYPPACTCLGMPTLFTSFSFLSIPVYLPVPVDKFFFSFFSAYIHNYNLHMPTHAFTPFPAPTHMCLSGHAHASHPIPTLPYTYLPDCAHACLPMPVGKFFFFFLSTCVYNCNLYMPMSH